MRAESSNHGLTGVPAVHFGYRELNRKRCAHGALGVVFLRYQMTEIGDELAPPGPADHAAVSGDGGGRIAAERANDGAKLLGVVGATGRPEPARVRRRAQ